MPLYEFMCKNEHLTERIVTMAEFKESIVCPVCKRKAPLKMSKTGAPVLKAGRGGFYKPTREELPPAE